MTGSASFTEMAKPTLVAAVVSLLRATAVLIPTTSPAALTSAPPEFPEEIAASVWISPSRNSPSVPIVRSSADTMPSVTDGSPSSPRENPMAITSSPRWTLSGSAKVAGWYPSPAMRSRARSLPVSTASRFASRGSVSPARRTRIDVAPLTTWALVRISPSAEMITPVPSAWPPSTSVLIVTIDGAT